MEMGKYGFMENNRFFIFLNFYRANMAVENCKIRIFPLFYYFYPLHLRHINISQISIFSYFRTGSMTGRQSRPPELFFGTVWL